MEDVKWCAGLFEGEGCITLRQARLPNDLGALVCQVANTDRALLEPFLFWGGVLRACTEKSKVGYRPVHRWTVAARAAIPFLLAIQPHVKSPRNKERVALALEYQNLKTRDTRISHSPEYRAALIRMDARMADLNFRGRKARYAVA